MSTSPNVATFRKVTPGILQSARLAREENLPDINKSEIAITLKKVAPVLGIDGTAYHIMDILLGLTRAADWCEDGRPIVAISNARLADYVMRSERTVTRCIKRLVEAGILAYRDSPTGRRYVYHGQAGNPGQTYGLDFTPARARALELKQMARHYQLELAQKKEAKRAVSRLSRAIADIAALVSRDDALRLHGRLESVLTMNAPASDIATALDLLYLDALDLVMDQQASSEDNTQTMSSEGDIDVTPYTNTNPESYFVSKEKRTCSKEHEIIQHNDGQAIEKAFKKKPEEIFDAEQELSNPKITSSARNPQPDMDSVSIGMLQSASTEAQKLLGVRFTSWSVLYDSATSMRLMIGLSEPAWQGAVEKLGLANASAILATVCEKALRDSAQISSPGGYFRAMVDRAGEGKLHLMRSLYGLVETETSS